MQDKVLQLIKQEIEKIETDPKHGQILITIQGGKVTTIKPTPCILLDNSFYK